MRVTSSAVSLTVDDVAASSKFLATHFGFVERMGERLFMVTDPNGISYEPVEWPAA